MTEHYVEWCQRGTGFPRGDDYQSEEMSDVEPVYGTDSGGMI